MFVIQYFRFDFYIVTRNIVVIKQNPPIGRILTIVGGVLQCFRKGKKKRRNFVNFVFRMQTDEIIFIITSYLIKLQFSKKKKKTQFPTARYLYNALEDNVTWGSLLPLVIAQCINGFYESGRRRGHRNVIFYRVIIKTICGGRLCFFQILIYISTSVVLISVTMSHLLMKCAPLFPCTNVGALYFRLLNSLCSCR